MGTFSGLVIRAIEDEDTVTDFPEANARLTVQPSNLLDDPITIMANAEGVFTAPLPEDSYRVQARSTDSCESDFQNFDLVACETTTMNLYITMCVDGGGATPDIDEDGDEIVAADDCDDTDPTSTIRDTDADCDGVVTEEDCDDTDASIFPGAAEVLDDGIDQDCNGHDAITCEGFVAYADAEHCAVIRGSLNIEGTDSTDLALLHTLREIEGYISIKENSALESAIIPKLEVIGSLFSVDQNPMLQELSTPSLTDIGGQLYVFENPILSEFTLASLTRLGGSVNVVNNALLTRFAITGPTSIGGAVDIHNNDALVSFAIDGPSEIFGRVDIYGNDALTDISMTDLSAAHNLAIDDNAALCRSTIDAFVAELTARGWSSPVTVSGNNEGC